MLHAKISYSFCILPARKILNSSFEQGDKIQKYTGIFSRRYAHSFESSSSLVIKVLTALFEKGPMLPADIQALIVATTSGDCPSPATAHFVHSGLNLSSSTVCFDVASSCSSFLSALRASVGLVNEGLKTLVVATEVKHKILSMTDHRSRSLFADGAGGFLFEKQEINKIDKSLLVFTYQKINSDLIDNICIPVGGSKYPVSKENIEQNKLHLREPKKMYRYIVQEMIAAIEYSYFILKTRFHQYQLDAIYIHQANGPLISEVAKHLSSSLGDRLVLLISDVGNMVCATLPVLRCRTLFLRALFSLFQIPLKKENLISLFLQACKTSADFSYDRIKNKDLSFAILFTIKFRGEHISILDDNCSSLEESWLKQIENSELEKLNVMFDQIEQKNHSKSHFKTCDIFVTIGGGVQTLGMLHLN